MLLSILTPHPLTRYHFEVIFKMNIRLQSRYIAYNTKAYIYFTAILRASLTYIIINIGQNL